MSDFSTRDTVVIILYIWTVWAVAILMLSYMRKRGNKMETLIRNVEQWAKEKGIVDYKNWEKQFMKFQEEAIELHTEMVLHDICTSDKEDMKLEMGDVLVTLIILAKQQDIELSECLSMAWNKIKNRRGKTINGQFVKEEDLDEEFNI